MEQEINRAESDVKNMERDFSDVKKSENIASYIKKFPKILQVSKIWSKKSINERTFPIFMLSKNWRKLF